MDTNGHEYGIAEIVEGVADKVVGAAYLRSLKSNPQPEAEHALVDALAADAAGTRDRRKASQVPHRAIRIQLQVGNVGRRVREMRRVGEIERLRPELRADSFGNLER